MSPDRNNEHWSSTPTAKQTVNSPTQERTDELQRELQGQSPSPSPSPNTTDGQRRSQEGHFDWLLNSPFIPRSLVVENQGNVARDHLSVERTFLAYVRTSLVCVTAGVGLVQLLTVTPSTIPLRLDRFGKVLGTVTEVLAITILIIAVSRYFSVQKALLDGKYPAANLVIWLLAFAFVVIILIVFGLMLGITFS